MPELDHSGLAQAIDGAAMANIAFRCPKSGQFVQHGMGEESYSGKNSYLPVKCLACGKTHFVNRSTHKLLGHEDE